jgi:hypothetical protein
MRRRSTFCLAITGGQESEPRQNFYLEPELEPRKNLAALREKLRNFGKLLTKFRIHLTDRAVPESLVI